jgi:hypothetical protein
VCMKIAERTATCRRERGVLLPVSRAAWRLEQAERERSWALASARAEGVPSTHSPPRSGSHPRGCTRSWPPPTSTRPAAARAPLACPTCGREPTTRHEAVQHREDLAIVWLHLDGDRVTEARHCVVCQPHGPVIDVSCSSCATAP